MGRDQTSHVTKLDERDVTKLDGRDVTKLDSRYVFPTRQNQEDNLWLRKKNGPRLPSPLASLTHTPEMQAPQPQAEQIGTFWASVSKNGHIHKNDFSS